MNLGVVGKHHVKGKGKPRLSGTVLTASKHGYGYKCSTGWTPVGPSDVDTFPPHQQSTHMQRGRSTYTVVHHHKGMRAPEGGWNAAIHYKEVMQPVAIVPQSVSAQSNLANHLVQPRGNSKMKYPHWVSPYAEEVARFYYENQQDFAALTKIDMRYLLSAYSQLYSFVNSSGQSLSTFLFGTPVKTSMFKNKSLAYLGCYRVPVGGNVFSVYEKGSDDLLMEYVFSGDTSADKVTFYNFVQSRLASRVIGTGYEDLVIDPGMDKYKNMYCDEMLNGEGTECLYEQREYRDQNVRSRFLLKMSLTTTNTIPCTIDKYNYEVPLLVKNPDGLVLVYGSGDSKCALRFNWRNTYCVDPLWDGPPETGFRGTHKQFHDALAKREVVIAWPTFIVSDACGYSDQRKTLMEGFGNRYRDKATRAMDPDVTNRISAEIVEYWINQGYSSHSDNGEWFAMKCGVSLQYPSLFTDLVADEFRKTRPTNAELSALLKGELYFGIDDHREPLSEDATCISWARACSRQNLPIWIGNNQRMYHERSNTFPDRKYSYPEKFSQCMENARRNIILVMPYVCDDVSRDEVREEKEFARNVDFDELEHTSEPGSIIRSTDSEYSNLDLYFAAD